MKHFLSFKDYKPEQIQTLVARAAELKAGSKTTALEGKTLAMIFLNQSLRTRVSFEQAMRRFGGAAIALSPGKDVWSMEIEDGAVMNGDRVEHIKDAARVLSRYCDILGLRSFEDERHLTQFAKYATVPVVSLESEREHPCQALADMLTITERFNDLRGKKFVLTWAPHIKTLPIAVPLSAVYAAQYLGMETTVVNPEGFDLPLSGAVKISRDQAAAIRSADVVYAKSWTLPSSPAPSQFKEWMFSPSLLKDNACFLHCLPVRRNVEVSDAVMDSKQSAVIDQAENRLWAQAALLEFLLRDK